MSCCRIQAFRSHISLFTYYYNVSSRPWRNVPLALISFFRSSSVSAQAALCLLIDGALIELSSLWFFCGVISLCFSAQDVCQRVCRLLICNLMLALVAMREWKREREMRLDILLDSEHNTWCYSCGGGAYYFGQVSYHCDISKRKEQKGKRRRNAAWLHFSRV